MKQYLNICWQGLITLLLLTTISCDSDDENFVNVEISGFNTEAAYQSETVTIEGTNFDQVQFVFVDNRQADFQLDGNTISFVVPANADPGMATITLAMVNNYRVTRELEVMESPEPIINSISPTAVPSGENITVFGSSLDNIETVRVGGMEAEYESVSSGELQVTVPGGLPNNTEADIEIFTSTGETSSSSIFYVGENLIQNGEFEEGDGDDFDNWGKYNGADGLTATTAEGEAYSSRTLRAEGAGGNPWDTQFASDAAATVEGVEYTLTIWIRTDEGEGTMRFSTAPDPQYSGDYEISSEWEQIQWVFTANGEETQIMLDLGASAVTYFIDNVTLVATGEAGPQPVELLSNGGFEENDGDEFEGWEKYNGADLLTPSDEEVRSGNYALRAVGAGGDPWLTQMASEEMPTEPDVEYDIAMWIKGEEGSPGVGGIIRLSTQSPTGDAMYGPDMEVTAEWQVYEWTITANDEVTRIIMDLGTTEDAVYFIDDVSVLAPPQ